MKFGSVLLVIIAFVVTTSLTWLAFSFGFYTMDYSQLQPADRFLMVALSPLAGFMGAMGMIGYLKSASYDN